MRRQLWALAQFSAVVLGLAIASVLLRVVFQLTLASSVDPASNLFGEVLSGVLLVTAFGFIFGWLLAVILLDLGAIARGQTTVFEYRKDFLRRLIKLTVAWGTSAAALAAAFVTFGGALIEGATLTLPQAMPPSLVLGMIFGIAGVAFGVVQARHEFSIPVVEPQLVRIAATAIEKSMRASPELRYFLYLDADLVGDFLAQFEEGEFETYQLHRSSGSTSDITGHAALPGIGVATSQRWSGLERASYSMRLTPASQVARLIRLLKESGGLREMENETAIKRGDLLLVTGSAELTGFTRLAGGLRELDRFDRWFGSMGLGAARGRGLGRTVRDTVQELGRLVRHPRGGTKWTRQARMAAEMEGSEIPILVALEGSTTQVLARLQRGNLRVKPTRLEGQVRLLLKVHRVLRPSEELKAADISPDAPSLATAFQEGLETGDSQTQLLGRLTIHYPAIVATTIAIYEP